MYPEGENELEIITQTWQRLIDFGKLWQTPFLANSIKGIFSKSLPYMDTIHARNLKFGKYLPCMTFHKYDLAILNFFVFWAFFWTQMCPKMAAILDFWPFGGHKKTK